MPFRNRALPVGTGPCLEPKEEQASGPAFRSRVPCSLPCPATWLSSKQPRDSMGKGLPCLLGNLPHGRDSALGCLPLEEETWCCCKPQRATSCFHQ